MCHSLGLNFYIWSSINIYIWGISSSSSSRETYLDVFFVQGFFSVFGFDSFIFRLRFNVFFFTQNDADDSDRTCVMYLWMLNVVNLLELHTNIVPKHVYFGGDAIFILLFECKTFLCSLFW